jgi:hypothetical protein
MNLWKRNEIDRLRQKIEHREQDTRLVVSPRHREKMMQTIHQAYAALEQKNVQQAKTHLYEAEYHFLMARYEGKVIFYATETAGLASGFYLLLLIAVAALAIWYTPIRENLFVFAIILATIGGGIGGVTAVMSNAIGIRLETQAITTRRTWYVAKPILGAIMGMVTYFALASGVSLLSRSFEIENMMAVFLIGFLGGYLESFSTRVLNELAGKLAGEQKSVIFETDDKRENIDEATT